MNAVRSSLQSYVRTRPWLTWQLTTASLTVMAVVGLALDGTPAWGASTAAGIMSVAAVTLAAGLVQWSELAHRWQMLMPLLSVAGVALAAVEAITVLPALALVGAVPVLWLIFEFGRVGAASATLSVALLLAAAYLGGAPLPSSELCWAQVSMLSTAGVGLCLATRHGANRLRRKREVLEEQSVLLESTLELAHDRLLMVQALLDSVDAAIIGFDEDGETALENVYAEQLVARAAAGLHKPREEEQRHCYFEDRVTPVPVDQRVMTRAKRGEEVLRETYWFGPPEDRAAMVMSARQIRRSNGARFGAVVVGWDVTDILEAVRVREEFLTTVSHELRTPLTSIIGYQELVAAELEPHQERLATMLAVAQRNAGVLQSRVSQLLQASGADGPELRLRQVDVSTLLLDSVVKHQAAADSADVHLATAVEPGVSAHLDPEAWEQVVDNLVSNAIKYTRPGGSVEVTLETSGDDVTLHVVDTGVGMSRVERERAFERFYRATSARDEAIQGLGVGLSIVKEIVEAHGGHVALSSVPGRGTAVVVSTPCGRD